MKAKKIFVLLNAMFVLVPLSGMKKLPCIQPLKDPTSATSRLFDEDPRRYPKLFTTLQSHSDEPELQYALAIRCEHNPVGVRPEVWAYALGSLRASNGTNLTLSGINLTITELQQIILSFSTTITSKIQILDVTDNILTTLPRELMLLSAIKTILIDPSVSIPPQFQRCRHLFQYKTS